MCGIAGVVGAGASSHTDAVRAMVAALDHRGPDDSGVVEFDGAVLGAARLAIIDVEHGRQPLLGRDGGTALVCNGEIYGHGMLRDRCSGYPFRTGSDCEVILALYEQYGDEMLGHLPGTFAFALWDDRRSTLTLARDRFGERPLYWSTTDDGFLVFASETTALLASGLVRGRLDAAMVGEVLRQGYVPAHRSIWQGISSVPPASRVRSSPSGVNVDRWWTPPRSTSGATAEEAADWFRVELDRAVREQLEADVPVGAFLSGGVDSATVAILAVRHHPDLHAFSFDMPGNSETGFARDVADRHGIQLHVIRPDTASVADRLVDLAATWDEPFGDSSALPTSMLCEFARERVKVVLTGDGADELLGGYLVWARDCLDPVAATAATAAGRLRRRLSALRARGRSVRAGSGVARRYSTFRQYLDAEQLAAFGLPALDARDVDLSAYRYDNADDISRFDLDHYLPGDILVKTDRASMRYGLEVRSPFLDVAVAEGCLSLPPQHKFDTTHEKLLLRRAFGDLWPDSVRNRVKQGFGAPMADWLALSDVAELKHDLLVEPASPLFELVDRDAVQSYVEANDQRTWNLLMLASWWAHHRKAALVP